MSTNAATSTQAMASLEVKCVFLWLTEVIDSVSPAYRGLIFRWLIMDNRVNDCSQLLVPCVKCILLEFLGWIGATDTVGVLLVVGNSDWFVYMCTFDVVTVVFDDNDVTVGWEIATAWISISYINFVITRYLGHIFSMQYYW